MHRTFTHRDSHQRVRPARSLVVLAVLSALVLAGCSSNGSVNTTSAGTRDQQHSDTSVKRAPGAGAGAGAGVPGAKDSATERIGGVPGVTGPLGTPAATAGSRGVSVPAVGTGSKLTKTASLEVRVKNIEVAAAQVRTIAAGLQAQVLDEQIGQGAPGGPIPLSGDGNTSKGTGDGSGSSGASVSPGAPGSSGGFGTLTLSVPADKLDLALGQLARIGTPLRRTASSQDVTAQYLDTTSRLKTMRASVERVRALMTQARTIGQVVALEGELSRREADLESLESQLAGLKDSVARSPLTVSLSTAGDEPVATAGFVAGLRSGWDAFTSSASGLLRAVGTVLPFALFFALIGAPLIWWLRRRQQSSASAAST